MKTVCGTLLAVAVMATPVHGQRFEGIVVVGEAKVAAQHAQITLLGKRDTPVDSTTTDVFGGFTVTAPKAGKYSLLVRRAGYLPMMTETFELPEGEVLTDTVFLKGRQAELTVKQALAEAVRRTFGAPVMSALARSIEPDSMAVLRTRYVTLGDLIQSGRFLGLQLPNGSASACMRFSGERGCAQLFVDGLPVYYRPDQIYLTDVAAAMALRATEMGSSVTYAQRYDNSRYGVVLVFTNSFQLR